MSSGRRWALALAAATAALVPATGASGSTSYRLKRPDATLARINSLRASFGAPALTIVREWSWGCEKHMNYIRLNSLQHEEQAGRRGYTEAGAAAGISSVLFWPAKDPFPASEPLGEWAEAPYHQLQVLNPLLRRTGLAQGCMDTHRGVEVAADPYTEPEPDSETVNPPPEPVVAPPRLLAWPGSGTRHIQRSINACNERPANPFTELGWSCRRVGTALYVYALDATVDRCFYTEETPAVSLQAKGRAIPLQVTGDSCGWIVITGRALPARTPIHLSVQLAGTTLSRSFFATNDRRRSRR